MCIRDRWMEEARLDLMDQIGLNYRQMEDMEIISPVLSISVEYHSMVHFDDTVLSLIHIYIHLAITAFCIWICITSICLSIMSCGRS